MIDRLQVNCNLRRLAAIGLLTPAIAVILVILESLFLNLGPSRAALPFCIIFIVNQVISTLVILVQLNLLVSPAGVHARQITMKTMMVSMTSFSVFFAIARQLLNREHNWLMALSLGLLGLTFVGLTVALFTAITRRRTEDA